MPKECVLFIGLEVDEQRHMQHLLPQFDIELEPLFVTSIEEALEAMEIGTVRLVVLRIGVDRPRPDQDIRRLKHLIGKGMPVFLLIPQELASRVKSFFRAGADDFWVLPLDDTAFPTRFHVVLEWGHAMLRTEPQASRLEGGLLANIGPLGRSLWEWLRRWVGPDKPVATLSSEVKNQGLIAGKWEKLHRLGFGSFGEVWLVQPTAESGSADLAVAKIPHDSKLNTKFLREAAILRRLAGHDNSVQLIEIAKEAGKLALIQEYAEGQSLQAHLEQGMSAELKETAFLQLLAIMAFAHQQKIMHRDIKPENIILTHKHVLKLLDFGTAKDLTRRSVSNTMIGSRPFMAPEQIMGKSRLASDVWALGVILYTLSTECLPFYDENEKQLMDLILETEPERPRRLEPDLPEALEGIILRCLQKEPAQRYENAGVLREHLLAAFPQFGDGSVLPPFQSED
jgi:CheY-like chemotaxis protein